MRAKRTLCPTPTLVIFRHAFCPFERFAHVDGEGGVDDAGWVLPAPGHGMWAVEGADVERDAVDADVFAVDGDCGGELWEEEEEEGWEE